MSAFQKRLVSGFVLAALALMMIGWGPVNLVKAVVLAIILLSVWEFCSLVFKTKEKIFKYALMCNATFLASWIIFFPSYRHTILFALFLALLLIFLCSFRFLQNVQRRVYAVAVAFLALFYIVILFSTVAMIREFPFGTQHLILLFAITFLNDTGAYFVGKSLGRHKIAPILSPAKTWEGFFGGLISALLAAIAIKFIFAEFTTWTFLLCVAPLCAVFGFLGDLCESSLKRSLQIKDSGQLIPGHGGVLDRIDALLFTAPVYYFMMLCLIKV